MKYTSLGELHFDIDDHLNPWLPPSPIHRFPRFISHFLGHRDTPQKDVGNVMVWFWSFFGGFCGIAAVTAIFKYSGVFSDVMPPIIIASFGASAVLEYGVIGSPLGQPRNCLLGHFFSALCGVAVTKLFKYSDNFEDIKWLAGAVSVGLASSVMTFTNTAHPPGGATALLAAIDPDVERMGWRLLPYTLIGTSTMLGIALVINNIQRQFPMHWWTPRDVGGKIWRRQKSDEVDLEALEEQKTSHFPHHHGPGDLESYEEQKMGRSWDSLNHGAPVLPPPVLAASPASSNRAPSPEMHGGLERHATGSHSISAGSDTTMVHSHS